MTALALAVVIYLATQGSRMPLLALRGLLRIRNLVVLVVPFAAMTGVAYVIGASIDTRLYGSALAVVLVPGPLLAVDVVTRMRGRMDLAGALVLGTIVISLLFVGGQGALAAGALFTAMEAYALPAMIANALPTLRDRLRLPITIAARAAFAAVLVLAALTAPPLDQADVLAAVALLAAGIGGAALAALATGREITGSIAGAGLRDPALALVFAGVVGADAGVALVYAALTVGLGGLALLRK